MSLISRVRALRDSRSIVLGSVIVASLSLIAAPAAVSGDVGRYIRTLGATRTSQYGYSQWEFGVFGN